MKVGDQWTCPACGRTYTATDEGVRCYGRGHMIYESLERDTYSYKKDLYKRSEKRYYKDNQQTELF